MPSRLVSNNFLTLLKIFITGSGSCPECNVPLRRSNFRVQLFEDPMVEKEVDIRRRILKDYNKKEDDFTTLLEYNDYLEEIEDLIYNLCHNIDFLNTNKRIEQYKKDNRDVIMKNKSRLGREEYELEELLEIEKMAEEERRKDLDRLDVENKKKKIREKEALIDELMLSYEDASTIVNVYAKQAEQTKEESEKLPPVPKVSAFSTGIKFTRGTQQMFLPVPKAIEEGPSYVYEAPIIITEGPAPPLPEDIEAKGYIHYIRAETAAERAGGYKSNIACLRALQEALQGLYHGT